MLAVIPYFYRRNFLAKAPLRRNPLQQQQRDDTRRRITNAALKVFFERGYVNSSIEHVLKEASVSRAAFYSHFEGKLSVVSAIAQDYHPQWQPIFQYLADLTQPNFSSVEHWARLYLKNQKDNLELCTLLTQVTILEEPLYRQMADQRQMLIEKLAVNHSAFSAALSKEELHIEADVLLFSLNQICFHAAKKPLQHSDEIIIRILANQMLEFMNRAPLQSPTAR